MLIWKASQSATNAFMNKHLSQGSQQHVMPLAMSTPCAASRPTSPTKQTPSLSRSSFQKSIQSILVVHLAIGGFRVLIPPRLLTTGKLIAASTTSALDPNILLGQIPLPPPFFFIIIIFNDDDDDDYHADFFFNLCMQSSQRRTSQIYIGIFRGCPSLWPFHQRSGTFSYYICICPPFVFAHHHLSIRSSSFTSTKNPIICFHRYHKMKKLCSFVCSSDSNQTT